MYIYLLDILTVAYIYIHMCIYIEREIYDMYIYISDTRILSIFLVYLQDVVSIL